jgi:hypothetical protein
LQIIGVAPVGSGAGIRGMTVQVSEPRAAAPVAGVPGDARGAESERLEAEAVVFPRRRGREIDARPDDLKRKRAAARYRADGGSRRFNPRDA